MPSPLSPRRLLCDSLPIPLILLVWVLPGRYLGRGTGQALFVAGLAMAVLYVVVRGAGLSSRCRTAVEPADPLDVLEENVRVPAVAAVWFVAAQVLWYAFSSPLGVLPDLRRFGGFDAVILALNGAGAGTVLLYAVAVGRARFAADPSGIGPIGG